MRAAPDERRAQPTPFCPRFLFQTTPNGRRRRASWRPWSGPPSITPHEGQTPACAPHNRRASLSAHHHTPALHTTHICGGCTHTRTYPAVCARQNTGSLSPPLQRPHGIPPPAPPSVCPFFLGQYTVAHTHTHLILPPREKPNALTFLSNAFFAWSRAHFRACALARAPCCPAPPLSQAAAAAVRARGARGARARNAPPSPFCPCQSACRFSRDARSKQVQLFVMCTVFLFLSGARARKKQNSAGT